MRLGGTSIRKERQLNLRMWGLKSVMLEDQGVTKSTHQEDEKLKN